MLRVRWCHGGCAWNWILILIFFSCSSAIMRAAVSVQSIIFSKRSGSSAAFCQRFICLAKHACFFFSVRSLSTDNTAPRRPYLCAIRNTLSSGMLSIAMGFTWAMSKRLSKHLANSTSFLCPLELFFLSPCHLVNRLSIFLIEACLRRTGIRSRFQNYSIFSTVKCLWQPSEHVHMIHVFPGLEQPLNIKIFCWNFTHGVS